MSDLSLHVRHLRTHFEKNYRSVINMTDVKASSEQLDQHFFSRALAAYFIEHVSGLDPSACGNQITDTFDDNGIDAIYLDSTAGMLNLVQSKFIASGKGGPDQGEVLKFCRGIELLINANYSSFPEKFKSFLPTIEAALDEPRTRIVAALITTGDQFSSHALADLEALRDRVNDPSDYLSIECLGLKDAHAWLTHSAAAKDIEFEILLSEWGKTDAPLVSFYGQVSCSELVSIYHQYGSSLFTQNIRKFLGDTAINASITRTATETPDVFLFANNGVVVLCEQIEKTPKGGGSRDVGTFKCRGAQVVNGAQTIGALAVATSVNTAAVLSARILVRLIQVRADDRQLASTLTQSTNTQNRVEKKDFVTLDPRHEAFRLALLLDGVEYVYKSGDQATGVNAFGLEEAATALACAHGALDYAIHAKKEIGKLWEQLDAAPYTDLFTQALTAERLWRIVRMARAVDVRLAPKRKGQGDERNLAVHGNRIIQHLVFKVIDKAILNDNTREFAEEITTQTDAVFDAMKIVRAQSFSDGYLGRLFYNQTKTRSFVAKTLEILARPAAP